MCGYKHDCHCDKKRKCRQVFIAVLSGLQEVPKIDTKAKGFVRAVLKKNKLKVTGWFKKLEGKFAKDVGAHIHLGMAGRNGEVVFTLNPKLSCKKRSGEFLKCDNDFHLTDEQVRDLKDRRYYINIHSEAYLSGELRGQLLPKSHRYFLVNLAGENEVPPVTTDGKGTLVAELNNFNLTVSGSFDNLSSPIAFNILGGAHIHKGAAGVNGPVVFVLHLNPDEDDLGAILPASRNVYALTCKQEKTLKNKKFYVNIHSENHPGGELRAQILPMKRLY